MMLYPAVAVVVVHTLEQPLKMDQERLQDRVAIALEVPRELAEILVKPVETVKL
jgi:hypothetical protein